MTAATARGGAGGRRAAIVSLGAALALALFLAAGRPAAASEVRRAVVVLLPGVSWGELARAIRSGSAPGLARVAREGGMALMNVRTGGRGEAGDGYLALGTGARAPASPAAGEAYQRGEDPGLSAAAVYRLRMGREPPGEAVLHLGYPALVAAADQLPYAVRIGGLGEALAEAGVRRAVFGNADRFGSAAGQGEAPAGGQRGRFAVEVAMDRQGAVDEGRVGVETLTFDPSFPGGWRTDEGKLAHLAALALSRGEPVFLVLETGDLWRVEGEASLMTAEAYDRARRQALARADGLVAALLGLLDRDRDLLLVLSPVASLADRGAGCWVAPLLAWGAGIPPSLLVSSTTRQAGFVANVDVAPSLLAHFGLPQPGWAYGRAWHPAAEGRALAERMGVLDALERALRGKQLAAGTAMQAYIAAQVAVASATLAALAGARALAAPAAWAWLVLAAAPLAFLALGPAAALVPERLAPAGLAVLALLVALAMAVVAALAAGRSWYGPFALLATLTLAAVAADAQGGSRLMESSLLGHSLVGGARYYGVGNEYAGVVLGAALFAGGALLESVPGWHGRLLASALWCGVIYLLANPALGADLGGTVAASAGMAPVALGLWRPRLERRTAVAAGGLAALAGLLLFLAFDLRMAGESSHVAALARAVGAGDWQALANTLRRKLGTSVRLLRWTDWSYVFLAYLATVAWLAMRPPGRLRSLLAPHPGLGRALAGVPATAVALLLVNDSGIVAAATAMIFGTAPVAALAALGTGEGTWAWPWRIPPPGLDLRRALR